MPNIFVVVVAAVAVAGLSGIGQAAETHPNSRAVSFVGQLHLDDAVAALAFDLSIENGGIRGTVTVTPDTGIVITGPVRASSFWENGRCYVELPGPDGTSYEFGGPCTTESFTGSFETSGPGEFRRGRFQAHGVNAATAAAALQIPAGRLSCYWMAPSGDGTYSHTFSNMGSITLQPDGVYVAGTGVTGSWRSDGQQVALVGGPWNGRTAQLDQDRTGASKLIFSGVDPAPTHCTQQRE